MPWKPKPPCPRCHRVQCACGYAKEKQTRRRQVRPYSSAARYEHERIVKAWVAEHGWLCPGDDEHAPHHVPPGRLCVDHLVPVSMGGAAVGGPKRVQCRKASDRQGGRLSHA